MFFRRKNIENIKENSHYLLFLLFIIYYLLFIIYYLLFIIYYLLFTIYYLCEFSLASRLKVFINFLLF
jgi:hypothetical protein